jgi:hypothetical protein
MGGGGAQRPTWGGNELKKTGARSARARTLGQNPLVTEYLLYSQGALTMSAMAKKSLNFGVVFLLPLFHDLLLAVTQ